MKQEYSKILSAASVYLLFAGVAEKYTSLVDKVFESTGNLWEKYNVAEGSLNVNHESKKKMPAMMGWSAGVYLAALNYIEYQSHCPSV